MRALQFLYDLFGLGDRVLPRLTEHFLRQFSDGSFVNVDRRTRDYTAHPAIPDGHSCLFRKITAGVEKAGDAGAYHFELGA